MVALLLPVMASVAMFAVPLSVCLSVLPTNQHVLIYSLNPPWCFLCPLAPPTIIPNEVEVRRGGFGT